MPASVRGEKIGRYELLAQLTAGGMSQLFLGATTEPSGVRHLVVIKRIVPDSAGDENFISMFLDEARITASFLHSSIAQVLDLGKNDGGLYVAMELISGANLNDVFDACAAQQEVLPLGFSASVVHDCALALHYAHTFRTPSGDDGSVIHRDVAQKNIMVTYDGEVKLLDFGIAKARNALSRTKAGTVKGTAGYMSPEQVRGEPLDGRSDVFSLGIVLWEMITGRRLFSAGTEADEMRLILKGPIMVPHEFAEWIPRSLSEVAMKALARDRTERYASARELARALEIQCSDVLYDTEQRDSFMHKLFAERVAAMQTLFEAAKTPDQPHLLDAALLGLELHSMAISPSAPRPERAAPTTPSAKASGPRRKKRDDDTSRVDELMLLKAIEADRLAQTRKPLRSHTMPFVLAVVALLCVGLAAKIFVVDRRATRSGLQRYPGDPVEEESAPEPLVEPDRAVPGVVLPMSAVTPKAEPVGNQVVVLPAPMLRVEKPVERQRGGQGDVTLAIFPEASVFRGSERLGSGNLISFALPAGTHQLTVVGADGVQHSLPLLVAAGKNKPQRYRLEDLPAKAPAASTR